jgi:pseudolysin
MNMDDGGQSPINYAYSPNNDVNYFLNMVYKMFTQHYKVRYPAGKSLPIYVFNHFSGYENASATSKSELKEMGILGPQQIKMGNGDDEFAPLTDAGTCAHEFAHLVTGNYSNLIYEGESGGINESFSDMTEFAFKYYLSQKYPWYWDQVDWTIGADTNIYGVAIRYMDNPSFDGDSIEHIDDYYEDMGVHNASGILNKAFYLLSNKSRWNVDLAYKVMLYANLNFWTDGSNFEDATCGAIAAAEELRLNHFDVVSVFKEVGLSCRELA